MTFTVAGVDAEDVLTRMSAEGINVSTSKPSSTLLDARARSLPSIVRASPHYYNTEDEVERFAGAVAAA